MIELLALLLAAGVPRVGVGAATQLQVIGDVGCPRAGQVSQSLARLNPDLAARRWTVELSSTGSDLGLRVIDPSGAVIGERRFAGLPDCRLRADAVAATLAVWLGELTAPPLPAPPALDSETEPPLPSRENTLHPKSATSGVIAPASPPGPAYRWQLELGAAALASLDQTGAGAGGVNLSTWVRPLARWWGLQAHLEWEAPRSLPLGPGFADWQRVTLGAGAHFPLQRGRSGFELEADLLAGVAVTQGRSLTVSHLDAGLEPGFFAGARFFVDPQPSWRSWLAVGLALWPIRQQVGLFTASTSSPAALASLPQLELLLALGGSWLD